MAWKRWNPFQSTLPVRGGTGRWAGPERRRCYFNPPSPCGEGQNVIVEKRAYLPFQSTLPVRGGTDLGEFAGEEACISIHPPRAGRDDSALRSVPGAAHFNPPSPCGEGPTLTVAGAAADAFQSTLPVWGRDRCMRFQCCNSESCTSAYLMPYGCRKPPPAVPSPLRLRYSPNKPWELSPRPFSPPGPGRTAYRPVRCPARRRGGK